MRRLVPELPRVAWIVVGGVFLSALGSGMTLPFFVVYLHRVRGIDLGLAGLALAAVALASFAGNVAAGALADGFGARLTLVIGLVVAAAGTAGFAFVTDAPEAVAAAAVIGLGVSVCWPSDGTEAAGRSRPTRFIG